MSGIFQQNGIGESEDAIGKGMRLILFDLQAATRRLAHSLKNVCDAKVEIEKL